MHWGYRYLVCVWVRYYRLGLEENIGWGFAPSLQPVEGFGLVGLEVRSGFDTSTYAQR